MKRLTTTLSFCIVAIASPVFAQCELGKTTAFYANGVNVGFHQAVNSLLILQSAVTSRTQQTGAIEPGCLGFALTPAEPFLTTDAKWKEAVNVAVQAGLIGGYQIADQSTGYFLQWGLEPLKAAPWFNAAWGYLLSSAQELHATTLQTAVNKYTEAFDAGRKAIVVAHSQGNLYTNQAKVLLSSPPAEEFAMVSVATPANNVLGNSKPYVTLRNDIINLVPDNLDGNADEVVVLPNAPQCLTSTNLLERIAIGLRCHAFSTSYMVGAETRAKIVKETVDLIPLPLRVTTTGEGAGTVRSQDGKIDCGDSCSTTYLPFSAQGGQTEVTLTATPESDGSKFIEWSWPCPYFGTVSDNTVTFTMSNGPEVFAPRACEARFENPTVSSIERTTSAPLLDRLEDNEFPRGGFYEAVLTGERLSAVSEIVFSHPNVYGYISERAEGELKIFVGSTGVPEGSEQPEIRNVRISLKIGDTLFDDNQIVINIVRGDPPKVTRSEILNNVAGLSKGNTTLIRYTQEIESSGNIAFGFFGCALHHYGEGSCRIVDGTWQLTGTQFLMVQSFTIEVTINAGSRDTEFSFVAGAVDAAGQKAPDSWVRIGLPIQ